MLDSVSSFYLVSPDEERAYLIVGSITSFETISVSKQDLGRSSLSDLDSNKTGSREAGKIAVGGC